jgi:hypothetical protein
MRSLMLVLPVLTACAVYQQHRTALVPHAAPATYDGQPMEAQGSVSIGADNLFDSVRPTSGDATQGDEVPTTQLRGQAALRVSDRFSVAGVYEHAITQGATVLSSTAPQITDATLDGGGISLRWSVPTEIPGFRVAVATEVVLWHVPWVEYNKCEPPCSYGTSYGATNSEIIPTLALAVVPSYRTGRMTYFGGATLRNQPTITEVLVTTQPDSDGGPNSGQFNLTVHAGVGVDVGAGIHANVFVHETMTTNPISYSPSVGMEVVIPFGNRATI